MARDTSQLMIFLVENRLWVGIGAAFTNLGTAVLLGVQPSFVGALVQFLTFFAIYHLNSLSDIKEDVINKPVRAVYAQTHASIIILVTTLSILLALIIAQAAGGYFLIGVGMPFVVGLLYSFGGIPVTISPIRTIRLKNIPYVKNLSVACAWGGASVLLQFELEPISGWQIAACTIVVAATIFINSIIFDFRDTAADRDSGIYTIPVLIGEMRTLRLAHWLNGLLLILAISLVKLEIISIDGYGLILLALYRWGYISLLEYKVGSIDFICDVIADGELILFGIIMFISRLLF